VLGVTLTEQLSDAVLKTDLKNCGSCAQKRADLNRLFPLP
jgi:hypothetical protein